MKATLEGKILDATERLIQGREFAREHTIAPQKNFVRMRKLSFATTMEFVLGNTRESLELSSERLSETAGIGTVSAAALCKARAKIDYSAFQAVFQKSASLMPVEETYEGYQLIAIDGMRGELPNIPALRTKYPVTKAMKCPQFHAIAAYDVLNQYFMSGDFVPAPGNEHQMAADLLKDPIFSGGKRIFLFDRGFPSVALIQSLNGMGHKFVMRVSKHFLREVNAFTDSKYIDRTIKISYQPRRGATNRVKADLPYDFTLRCVRIRFIDGTEEICITNLPREQFPKRKIKQLYGLRWEIETSYNYLKHAVFIEEFTARKENGIKQDFYASLWAANLASAAIRSAAPAVKKNETDL